MEDKNTKYDYCKHLNYEDTKREYLSCFDENNELINPEKLSALQENHELTKYLFSDERLIPRAQQEDDLLTKASSEIFLNKSYPPSWYWEMPDYYYPGFYNELIVNVIDDDAESDTSKIISSTTRNETVLRDCGWEREKYDIFEYFNDNVPGTKIVFDTEKQNVSIVKFDPETNKEILKTKIPFSLLCGIFLKCRELNYKKPWQLRAHDYKQRFPEMFEEKHHIIRDKESHEIIDYGDWNPSDSKESNTQE